MLKLFAKATAKEKTKMSPMLIFLYFILITPLITYVQRIFYETAVSQLILKTSQI